MEKKAYAIKEREIAFMGVPIDDPRTWEEVEPSDLVEAVDERGALLAYARSKERKNAGARIVRHKSGLTTILYFADLFGKEIKTGRKEIRAEKI